MKQFLPFLTDDTGRSLTVENEVVVTSSIPDPLNNSPEGWENNTLQWARNKEFYGIIKSYTTSLKFYLQGAKILRNAFYKLGMETVLFFIWLKQNVTFGAGMKYEGWYKGEPDFSTFKDEWDGVEISITEGGFFKDLQANKSVVYEVPFDADAKYVYMDGMFLNQKLDYADITELDISLNNYGEFFLGPYPLVGQDGSSVGFLIGNETLENIGGSYSDATGSDNVILQNLTNSPITITIAGRISVKCTGMTSSPAYGLVIRYLTSTLDITHQNDYRVLSTPNMVVGQSYAADFSLDITLQPNETLLRQGFWAGGVGSDAIFQFLPDSVSNITFKTRSPANLVPIYRAFDYGKKLVTKMSSLATFSSPLLENDYNLMVTNGDSLRNIDSVIKGTFSSYFKSIDAVKCAALDIVENVPILSSRYDKYNKNSVIAALGECSNWTLEPANDYVYDTVESGYPSKSSQSNDDVNGKLSFNNTYQWKVGVTRRNKNTYKCKADYYADPYDIELIRVNFLNKDTTTANTDDSIFFLDCEPKTDLSYVGQVVFDTDNNTLELSGDLSTLKQFIAPGLKIKVDSTDYTIVSVDTLSDDSTIFKVEEYIPADSTVLSATITWTNLYQLRRKTYATINGIINDGTVFNIELSPRRCLENHLRWLRSSFDHLDMQYLNFLTTDKNANLQTIDGSGNIITEKADIQVGTMGEKVFLPYLVKMEVKSPQNLLELMTTNHDGVFGYTREGLSFDGFPIQISTNDATLESQEFSLLCSANCNLELLINNR